MIKHQSSTPFFRPSTQQIDDTIEIQSSAGIYNIYLIKPKSKNLRPTLCAKNQLAFTHSE